MDKNTIVVAVESLPTDTYTQLLPWATGIILPIALFFVSKTFASKAEKSANKFTIKLHEQERIHIQKNRAISLLDDVYRITHKLKRVSAKQRISDDYSQSLLGVTDKILASKNEQAVFLHQENLRLSANKNEELEDLKSDYCIGIHASVGQLSTIIGDIATSNLATGVKDLTEKSSISGGIKKEDTDVVVNEVNTLSNRLIRGEIKIESI